METKNTLSEIKESIKEIIENFERINQGSNSIKIIDLDILSQKTSQLYENIILLKKTTSDKNILESINNFDSTDPENKNTLEFEQENIQSEIHSKPDKDKTSTLIDESLNKTADETKFVQEEEVLTEPVIREKREIKNDSVNDLLRDIQARKSEKKAIIENFTKEDNSINTRIAEKQEQTLLADKIQKGPISDIKSAINLNLRLSFIKELFEGNQKEYKKLIDFLNKCENYSEAKFFIQEKYENKPSWVNHKPLVNILMDIIRRKFQ